MKKIGILHGMESTFPDAFIERVNSFGLKDIRAERVLIDIVEQSVPTDYSVIIDRISQDVPFYRAYLKNAAICGTAVINNPFWWSADEKFFNNALAVKLGVPVPKTVILPSFERPTDTSDASFKNLAFPLSWEKIFNHIGFPAYMKPHAGGGWKSVYKVRNQDELFSAYHETGQLVMLLQEEIVFEEYFRCYCLGGKYVRIMQYEPRNPHHLRYVVGHGPSSQKLLDTIHDYVLRLNHGLGYDFNTVEFAVRNGVPYAIDFCNPAPDADVNSVGQENFDWVVEHAAKMAIERAQNLREGVDNLTWGNYITRSVAQMAVNKGVEVMKNAAQKVEDKIEEIKKSAPAKKAVSAVKKAVEKAEEVLNTENKPVKKAKK
jgi:glutathione synthase/RimK-type ligase-like ATP-grasp enzyme